MLLLGTGSYQERPKHMSVQWGLVLADEFSTADSSLLHCTAAAGLQPACTPTANPVEKQRKESV